MTDTIGKIESLSKGLTVCLNEAEHDDLTIAYMIGMSKGIEKANKNAIERVAKWLCIQHDEDPVLADGSENWKEYTPMARQVLGVN